MQHLDTQVISYAIKGKWENSLGNCVISSIVANELFLVQGENPAKANLYIPLLSSRHFTGAISSEIRKRKHPFGRHHSDSILMDFANEYPTIIEYNNISISNLINEGLTDLMYSAVNHLDKETKKTLKRRFRFLVENNIKCVPLNYSDIECGFGLLSTFKEKHNPKNNFRNTWNDILILSSAIGAEERLVTEDGLLSRFASENYEVKSQSNQQFVELNFSKKKGLKKKIFRESKGYINHGWKTNFYK